MSLRTRNALLMLVAAGFTVTFVAIPGVALVTDYDGDVIRALGDGFVNPMSSGYALDTILCWVALAIWVYDERARRGVRGGWVALLLGLFPGVVVGLVAYLVMRDRQIALDGH